MISSKGFFLVALCALSLSACGGAKPQPAQPTNPVAVKPAEPETNPILVHVCSESKGPVEKGHAIRVEIRGRGAPALLCERFPVRAGDDLEDATTDLNIRSLYAEGRVEDIVVVKETRKEGIVVVYDVKIRKRIGSLKVRPVPGLDQAIADGLITDGLSWENNAQLDALTRRAISELAFYGYRRANIAIETTPEGEDTVNVMLVVEPGPRAMVGTLNIEGVSPARLPQIQPLLRTKVGEPFSQEMLERDVLVITADLFDRGMLTGSFSNPEVVESKDGSKVDIKLTLTEGPVFKLRNVKFVGDLLGPQAVYLREAWRTKAGAVFSRSEVVANIERVKELHASRGGPVEVEIDTALDPKALTVDVTVRIKRP